MRKTTRSCACLRALFVLVGATMMNTCPRADGNVRPMTLVMSRFLRVRCAWSYRRPVRAARESGHALLRAAPVDQRARVRARRPVATRPAPPRTGVARSSIPVGAPASCRRPPRPGWRRTTPAHRCAGCTSDPGSGRGPSVSRSPQRLKRIKGRSQKLPTIQGRHGIGKTSAATVRLV